MINNAITNPKSIVIIGGSNHLEKPGGKMVKNLIDGDFYGELYVVNPKESEVQGLPCFQSIHDIPSVDLAILAVTPKICHASIKVLTEQKQTTGFIIISAGFGEGGPEGKLMEEQIVEMINAVDGCLIGPNCIGVLNPSYQGVFTTPTPELYSDGCDFISSSGATALFTMEAGIPIGLRFSSVYSVGNAAQTGVEEVLQYLDESYVEGESSKIKLLYMETIRNPQKLLKHATSLIKKGARIAGIKAGSTEAGSRAAASHTGAIANSDMAVRALFRKAGIVYCSSREELITVASIFNCKKLKGKNIAIITHAGGSAVMLSDSLSKAGLQVPQIDGPEVDELLSYLHPGSYASNPIDFLATGTAEQLGIIIDYCEHKFDNIDAMVVVFGSPGLFNVANVYDVLRVKLDICKKPIFPVLPSVINANAEINSFLSKGNINFPDEVLLGTALGAVYNTTPPAAENAPSIDIDKDKLEAIIADHKGGFLSENTSYKLLEACGIPIARQTVASDKETLLEKANSVGYPLVAKVIGPLHKTEVKGVHLNIRTPEGLSQVYDSLMQIEDAQGVLIQKMYKGLELFIGATRESGLGHMLLFGLGGIFVEIFKDVRAGLVPLGYDEIETMMKRLQAYPLINGVRGKEGINQEKFIDLIMRISKLLELVPAIKELDINPLIASTEEIVAVDVIIKVDKEG
ncbi:MAG: acetate--CoA ligase family protein [Bacteroidia bacterium]